MEGDGKMVGKGSKQKCEKENPWFKSCQRLASSRRLAEFKNLCKLDGDIHNSWEAIFQNVPDKGPFQRSK